MLVECCHMLLATDFACLAASLGPTFLHVLAIIRGCLLENRATASITQTPWCAKMLFAITSLSISNSRELAISSIYAKLLL